MAHSPRLRARLDQRRRGWWSAIFEPLSDRLMLAAEVVTDLQDYSPGQTAVITAGNNSQAGTNFVAGERIRFQVVRTDGIEDAPPGNLPWYVTDGVGGFTGRFVDSTGDGQPDYGEFPDTDGVVNAAVATTWYVEPQYIDSFLQVQAAGSQSRAFATHDFTDRVSSLTIAAPRGASPLTLNPGQQFLARYSVRLTNVNTAGTTVEVTSQVTTARIFQAGQQQNAITFAETDNIGTTLGILTRSFNPILPSNTPNGTYTFEITVTQTFVDGTTASGTLSEASAIIVTDAIGSISSVTVGAQTGTAVYGGAVDSVTFSIAGNRATNGSISGTYGFSGLPAGVTGDLSTTAFSVSGSTAPTTSTLTLQVAASVAAGTYSFTVTCVVGGTTYSSSASLTVARAPLTITALDRAKTYGNTFIFATSSPGDFSVATLFNSDTVTSVSLSSSGAAATADVASTPYTITVASAAGSGLANYNITYVAGGLTVNRRALSFTIGNASILYGETANLASFPGTLSTGVGAQTLLLSYASAGNTGTATAGSYAITASAANGTGSAANYDVSFTNGTLTVGRRSVSYTIGNAAIAYGDTTNFAGLPSSLATGFGSESLALNYSSTGNSGVANVGTYALTATVADSAGLAANYTVNFTDGVFTVGRRTVPFTIGNVEIVYTNTTNFASLPSSLSTGVGSQTLELTYASTGNTGTADAGLYAITATAADGTGALSNYDVAFTPGTLTVGRRPLSFTIGDVSIAYGNTTTFASLASSFATGIGAQTLGLIYASTGNTGTANVGGYAITATTADGTGRAANYDVTFTEGTLTVGRRPVSFTIGDASIAYGNTTDFASLSSTLSTGVGDQTLALTYSSTGNTGLAVVGDYPIAATVANGTGATSNYDVTLTNGTLSVGRRPVSLTIGNVSIVYTSTTDFASLPSTLSTGVGSQTLVLAYDSTGNTGTANAGTYPITATAADGTGALSNYHVTFTNGTLNVGRWALSLTVDDLSIVYGNTTDFASLPSSLPTGIGTQTLGLTYASTGNTGTANVGAYAITATTVDGTGLAANYDVTFTNGVLGVGRRPLSVTVGNALIAYGDTSDFASLPSLVPTGVGTQSLRLSYSSSGNSGTAIVGSYAITATASNDTGALSNYDVSFTDGSLTVGRRPVSLTVGDVSITYGNTTTFASLPSSLATGVGDQTLTLSYSSSGNTGIADAGNYAITVTAASGTGELSNYSFTFVEGTLTIARRSVPFTIGDVSIVYSSTTDFASLPGTLLTGVGAQTLLLTYDSTGNSGTANAGSYPITATLADGTGRVSNYDVTFTNGTLNVNRWAVSFTVGDLSILYGNTTDFASLPNSLPTGVGTQTLGLAYASTGNTGTADVGTYPLTATAIDRTGAAANYDVSFTRGAFTVGRRPVWFTIGNASIAYGDTTTFASLPNLLPTGVGAQKLGLTYDSPGNSGTADVGSYAITATAANDSGSLSNYDVRFTAGALTVDRRTLPFTVENVSIVYGNTTSFASLPSSLSTGVGDQTLTLAYSSTGNTGTADVGNYAITATLAGGTGSISNYNAVVTNGTLRVARRTVPFAISDVAIVYGNTTTFASLPNSLSTGVGTQTLGLNYSSPGNTGTANAGSYAITATAVDGTGNVANYDVVFSNGTLNVGRRAASFTIDNVSIVYGNTTGFASLPSSFSTGFGTERLGLIYGSSGNTGNADVGSYLIAATAVNSSAGLAANYDVSFTNGTLTVGRRPLTFTIGNVDKDSASAIDLATRLPGTIATGVSSQSLSITYASAGAAANAAPGSYPITGTVGNGGNGGLATNYNVTLIPGELRVVSQVLILGADANTTAAPYVRVINSGTGTTVSKFLAYEASFRGGVRVVRADLTGDGVDEIITAPGRGRAPEVRVFSLSGTPLTAYNTLAYANTMTAGVQLAAGDVNGDGRVDLVTVPSQGAAEVRVFLNQRGTNADPMANTAWRQFVAFPASFTGGAVLALADMGRTSGTSFIAQPDGRLEILVGSGAGIRASVRFFDTVPATPRLVRTTEFFARTFTGGIGSIAVGRANNRDQIPDVIVGAGTGGLSLIEIRDGQSSSLISQFAAYTDASRRAPVRVIVRDTNNDNVFDEIWTAQGVEGKTRQLKKFRLTSSAVDTVLENDADLRGEYFLA